MQQDFANLLVEARRQAGLTQAQLAVSAGLTPSYLSFIENRKKPPPSDEVCVRLAKVLGIPERTVLEVAHMERAPEPLRKRIKSLNHSLKRERKSRKRLLESLLSPFLFAGPPGFRESALDALELSPARRRRIREVLAAVGRDRLDSEKEVSKIVDELPEKERNQLLEKLPEMLARERTNAKPGHATAEPPLLYEAGPPSTPPLLRFRLEVTRAVADEFDELREHDQLVVDGRLEPGSGDLLILVGGAEERYVVRRLEASGEGFVLATDRQAESEFLSDEKLAARLDQVWAGTVVEIRRPLRR